MNRAVGQFWPRAESRLYEEPKKLVAHRLAAAEREHVGQRPRTVYTITPEGRERLAVLVAQPAESPPGSARRGDDQGVLFAEHGSRDDLLATIESIRAWTDERLAVSAGIGAEYLEGRGAFPDRLPWLLLTGRLLDEHVLAGRRWAEWAAALVGYPGPRTRQPRRPTPGHGP